MGMKGGNATLVRSEFDEIIFIGNEETKINITRVKLFAHVACQDRVLPSPQVDRMWGSCSIAAHPAAAAAAAAAPGAERVVV